MLFAAGKPDAGSLVSRGAKDRRRTAAASAALLVIYGGMCVSSPRWLTRTRVYPRACICAAIASDGTA